MNSYSENPNKMQQCIKILLFLILHEAQHVSGDTPPIIRSLKLHKQPLAAFALTSCMNSYSENPNKMQQCIKVLLFLILHEAQHVSGDTPPIIRSLKLHKQPLAAFTLTSCMNSYSENPNKMQQCIKALLFLILHEGQHVSGDTQNFDTLLHLGGVFTIRIVL
jgi:hypothetical protein